MKVAITNARIERLTNAIKALDKPSPTGKPYDYKDRQAQVVYNLTRTLRVCEDAWKDVFDARNKLIKALLPPGETEIKGDVQNQFVIQFQDVLDEEVELDVRRIKLSMLNLDQNRIPAEVLSDLNPILIDDQEFPDE